MESHYIAYFHIKPCASLVPDVASLAEGGADHSSPGINEHPSCLLLQPEGMELIGALSS